MKKILKFLGIVLVAILLIALGITGVMDVTEKEADIYQQMLKDTIPQFKGAGVSLFIWDGMPWYDDPRNLTAHTIIATPAVWLPFEEQGQSIAGWLADAINGNMNDLRGRTRKCPPALSFMEESWLSPRY